MKTFTRMKFIARLGSNNIDQVEFYVRIKLSHYMIWGYYLIV